MSFKVIVADPPWQYNDKSKNRGGAERHYDTLTIEELRRINVDEFAADNALMFLWVTGPQLDDGINLLEDWGFEYRTVAFTWVKRSSRFWDNAAKDLRQNIRNLIISGDYGTPQRLKAAFGGQWLSSIMKDRWHWGMGHYTRANAEFVLLGVRGNKIPTYSHSVHSVIEAPVGRHSSKPDEFYDRVRELVGDCDIMELFSRTQRPGWFALGNQVDNPHFLLNDELQLVDLRKKQLSESID